MKWQFIKLMMNKGEIMQYFLTIDNGGTNTKAVICDAQGKQIAVTSFSTKRIEPQPGFQEIRLTTLLADIGTVIQAALKKAHLAAAQISAISVVGHGKGLYTLDQQIGRASCRERV